MNNNDPIQRTTGATLVYLSRDWRPVPPGEAARVKVIYDDGSVAFALPPAAQPWPRLAVRAT